MNDTTTIALRYGAFALDGLRMDGEIWLRVAQITHPLGFSSDRRTRELFERHRDEFTAGETRLIVEQTEGGPQQVRVFSLRGARLLAMLARTEPAARFRRWILDLLEGRAPVARPDADPMASYEEAQAVLSHPLIREAIEKLDEAAANDSEHARAQSRLRLEARRLAALAGLPGAELDRVRKLEKLLASMPRLRPVDQPGLALDGEGA
jgi:hypothetical protein